MIQKEKFISICKESKTMASASRELNMPYTTFIHYAKKYKCYYPNQGGRGTHKKSPSNKIELNNILTGSHPSYQTNKLRLRLIKEGVKEQKCEVCGISEWNGKEISLELHHMDGDNSNHKIENLKIVCPNCHSQTHTYRGKNIRK